MVIRRRIPNMTNATNFTGRLARVCVALLVAVAAIAAAQFTPPLGKWTRLSPDPIVSPHDGGFESAGTFNRAVVRKGGKFVMLYRAQDQNGTSSLGYATSNDGIH